MALCNLEEAWLTKYGECGLAKGYSIPWLFRMSMKKGLFDRFDNPYGYNPESPKEQFEEFLKLKLRPVKAKPFDSLELHYLVYMISLIHRECALTMRELPLRIRLEDVVEEFNYYHIMDNEDAMKVALLSFGQKQAAYIASRKKGEDIVFSSKEECCYAAGALLQSILPLRKYEPLVYSYYPYFDEILENEHLVLCPLNEENLLHLDPIETLLLSRQKEAIFFLDHPSDAILSHYQERPTDFHGFSLLIYEGDYCRFLDTHLGTYRLGVRSLSKRKDIQEVSDHIREERRQHRILESLFPSEALNKVNLD
ncbi:MAG: hypothetical protein SPL80_00230 [Bacilli bacterium]|nr:hypothetical protein [Bacilli bacterium]